VAMLIGVARKMLYSFSKEEKLLTHFSKEEFSHV
jgi:hypothetical protein